MKWETSQIRIFTLYLTIISFASALVLLNNGDIHDDSVLSGIWPSYLMVLLITLAMIIRLWNSPKGLALISMVFLTWTYLLPGMKYNLIYGTGDSLIHYRLALDISNLGIIPPMEAYGDFPITHILIVGLSDASSLPIDIAMKIVLPLTMGLVPLIIYAVSTRANVGIQFVRLSLLSSLILFPNYGYSLFAATLGNFFFIIFFYCVYVSWQKRYSSSHLIFLMISILFGLEIVLTHVYSTIMLLLGMSGVVVFALISESKGHSKTNKVDGFGRIAFSMLILIFIAALSWWGGTWDRILTQIVRAVMGFQSGLEEAPIAIQGGIFQQSGVFAFLQGYGGQIIILVLSVVGILVLYRGLRILERRKDESPFRLFSLVLGVGAAMGIAFLAQLKSYSYQLALRPMIYAFTLTSPILIGAIVLRARKSNGKEARHLSRLAFSALLLAAILISTLGFFPSETLTNETFVNRVNSIYQYEAAIFIGERIEGSNLKIIPDGVGYAQLYGFVGPESWEHCLAPNEIARGIKEFLGIEQSDNGKFDYGGTLIWIHNYGPAGFLTEHGYGISYDQINAAISQNIDEGQFSLIYDSGESFIFLS